MNFFLQSFNDIINSFCNKYNFDKNIAITFIIVLQILTCSIFLIIIFYYFYSS